MFLRRVAAVTIKTVSTKDGIILARYNNPEFGFIIWFYYLILDIIIMASSS